MTSNDLKIRLTAAQKAWLAATAEAENRSLTAQIQTLIDDAMLVDPLKIVIHHLIEEDREEYTVAVGESWHDFADGLSREQAVAVAKAKLKELGLPSHLIEFRTDDFRELGNAAQNVVPFQSGIANDL